MNRNRSRKKIYLTVFLLLFFLLGTGYAYMLTTLEIEGNANFSKNTWDVHYENLIEGNSNVEAVSKATISSNKTDISLELSLELPKDMYEFYVDVVNDGSVPAMVDEVGITGLTDAQKKYIVYSITYLDGTEVSLKDELLVGERKTIKVRIKYNDDITVEDLPTTDESLNLDFNLDYIQKDDTSVALLDNEYRESILNGAYPVLSDKLIPVTIESDGTVKKADTTTKWYSYTDKLWANAVILKDESIAYNNGDTILEENIESYFVWIPRYRYKLWNTDNHAETGVDTSVVHTIDVVFESRDYTERVGDENGEWLTHPAFISFDVNGLWVGKFETGYDGATTKEEAQVNSEDSSKIIIKSNVYSWRNIQVANAFYASYNYEREMDSHMMKNTEWGAVAYLSHSKYGIADSIRINNNSDYKTGYAATNEPTTQYPEYTEYGTTSDVTLPWNTTTGYLSSTTGNIYGVYDMSGGAHEYVMGVQVDDYGVPLSGRNNLYNSGFTGTLGCPTCDVGASGQDSTITSIIGKSLPSSKYYDAYKARSNGNRANGILGDATSELGPFGSVVISNSTMWSSSWYTDNTWFVNSGYSWFNRGGHWTNGSGAGVFYFDDYGGYAYSTLTFRLVLAF